MNLTFLGYFQDMSLNWSNICLIYENDDGIKHYSGEISIEKLIPCIEGVENETNRWYIYMHDKYISWVLDNHVFENERAELQASDELFQERFRPLAISNIRELLEEEGINGDLLTNERLENYKKFVEEFIDYKKPQKTVSIKPGEFGVKEQGEIFFYLGKYDANISILSLEDDQVYHRYAPDRKKHFYFELKEPETVGFYFEGLKKHLRELIEEGIENWDSNGTILNLRASASKMPFSKVVDVPNNFEKLIPGGSVQIKLNILQLYTESRRSNGITLLDNSLGRFVSRSKMESKFGEEFMVKIDVVR